MQFFLFILFFYSASLFSIEYTYSPPVGTEVSEIEFASWQEELTNQVDVVEKLVLSSGNIDSSGRYLNRLIFEASPYLLRHSLNPVNWYPWQAEVLAKAKKENKLIFLSIGYSTCHWCHVMEKESFINIDIAKTLNQSFISIKVDRELTPDVDLFFTQALELTKGSAGWPINAILTPDADVVWLDSYLSPEQFAKTISQLSKVWQARPQAVTQVAKNLAGQIKGQNRLSDIDWDIEFSEQAVQTLVNNLDPVHGGIAGDRKFPSASVIQLLLYQYQLKPEAQLKIHILRFLEKLVNQGIRDHVNGGFYRYSTDVMWQQPHFEKMLYNQALLISTFSKAYEVFQDESYKSVVMDTIHFVQKWLLSAQGGYYSGIDADYLGSEGLYYMFSAQELALIEPKELNEFNWCTYDATNLIYPCSYKTLDNSLTKPLTNSSNSSANTAQDKLSNKVVYQQSDKPGESLSRARKALLSIKSGLDKPHIDKKVITAWNALMISAYVDAYIAFNDDSFLENAIALADTLNSKHINSSGKLMRAKYLDKLAGKAVINDYAYLGNAMFELFQSTQNKKYYQLAVHYFQQGSLLFGKNYQGNKSVVNNLLNDGELISAHTVLLSLGYKLTHYGEKTSTITKIQVFQLKQAAMASIGGDFAIHELFLKHKYGVFDNTQSFAKGKGVIHLTFKDGVALFTVSMANGWHINSNKPLQNFLIPTKISDKNNIVTDIKYPVAIIKRLGFNQEKLSLFEDDFVIKAGVKNTKDIAGKIGRVGINLQACSDTLCLIPERLKFNLNFNHSPKTLSKANL